MPCNSARMAFVDEPPTKLRTTWPTGGTRRRVGLHRRCLRRLRHAREFTALSPRGARRTSRRWRARRQPRYFTTPGVAVIAQQRGGVGVVVSASHNPYYDNVSRSSDSVAETRLRDRTRRRRALHVAAPALTNNFEEFEIDESASTTTRTIYVHSCRPTSRHCISCSTAPTVRQSRGARDIRIDGCAHHDDSRQPNGRNITREERLQRISRTRAGVIEEHADLGLRL